MKHGQKLLKSVLYTLEDVVVQRQYEKETVLNSSGCKPGDLFLHFPLISAFFPLVNYWII